jgi:hypothetical protein
MSRVSNIVPLVFAEEPAVAPAAALHSVREMSKECEQTSHATEHRNDMRPHGVQEHVTRRWRELNLVSAIRFIDYLCVLLNTLS